MALVVEDGTGLANAESYLSVADANTYFTKFVNAAWVGEVPDLEGALRRATQYLDANYRFKGCKLKYTQTSQQALQWPRDAYTMTCLGITWPPAKLQQACAELAVRSLASDLYKDQDDRAIKSESVGPISTTYANPTNGGQVRFVIVDDLLAQYTMGSHRNARIEVA
jgi:hypothetical protein